jgi:hypothetical protein
MVRERIGKSAKRSLLTVGAFAEPELAPSGAIEPRINSDAGKTVKLDVLKSIAN